MQIIFNHPPPLCFDLIADFRISVTRKVYQIQIAVYFVKIKRSQVQKQIKILKEGLKLLPGTQLIPFSAETKQGRDEIWDVICSFVEEPSDERGTV